MFRNDEFKSIIIKLLIFQLAFGLLGFIIVNIFMDMINKKIIERDTGIVGYIIREHPELREDIIPYITKEVSREDITSGQSILSGYGYNEQMNKSYQPILKDLTPNIQIIISAFIFSFIIPLGFLIKKEYSKIYNKVNQVSGAAEKVVEGDFSIYLDEEGEGDFNILNHQFNQMANRLENSLDILKKEKVFLKNMISDISHQLKTPLSSLIVLNDLMLDNVNMELDTRNNFLDKSKLQIDRMEWLIINLLKVARIEAGSIQFKKEKVLLKDSLNIALEALETKLDNQNVIVKGNPEAFFYGDKDWTGETLINIIKNAVEHGKGKIEIILEDTPLFSTIRIKDNGEGIDEKHLPRLFDRFYKANSEVKPESIGIGLNLAKLIVESQDGTISVKTQKDVGTEFIITFLKAGNRQEQRCKMF